MTEKGEKKRAAYLLRILGVEEEELADDGIGGEIVNLIAEEHDALAKEETERVTGFMPGNHKTARANCIHEHSFVSRRKSTRGEGSTSDLIAGTAARHRRGSLGRGPPAERIGTKKCNILRAQHLSHVG